MTRFVTTVGGMDWGLTFGNSVGVVPTVRREKDQVAQYVTHYSQFL